MLPPKRGDNLWFKKVCGRAFFINEIYIKYVIYSQLACRVILKITHKSKVEKERNCVVHN